MKKVMLFDPFIHKDERGIFFEAYRGLKDHVTYVQDNVSVTKKGVVRGLHYQRDPMAQGKYLRCLKGAIFDVAVNLQTGEIHTNILDDGLYHRALYIPEGFAHGFQALTEDAILYYKCTEFYSKEHESGIYPLDQSLGIRWPLPVLSMSEKDKKLPGFKLNSSLDSPDISPDA